MIPRIVHQTAPADKTRWDPRWGACQKTWHSVCSSPKYSYILWDDDGLRSLVAQAFPDLLEAYDSYSEHIQRVDFARAAMLFIHGGLYADMDVEVLRNPFPQLPEGMVSVVGSPYVRNEKHQNSMMASPPKHPFWRAMADEAIRRQQLPGQFRTTWQLTGPQLLDAVVEMRPDEVYALPHAEFNPSVQSPQFSSPAVFTRHFCTSVWTHNMNTVGMALYQSVRMGSQANALEAIEAGADLESRDYAGLVPMHHAALRGEPGMVTLLASFKADVGAKDKNHTTPLHYAVQVSSYSTVQRLLELRADTTVQLKDGSAAGLNPVDLAWSVFEDAGKVAGSPSARVLALLDSSVLASTVGSELVMNRPAAPLALPTTQGQPSRTKEEKELPWWAAATKRKTADAPGPQQALPERQEAAAPKPAEQWEAAAPKPAERREAPAPKPERREAAAPKAPAKEPTAAPPAAGQARRNSNSCGAGGPPFGFTCRAACRRRRAWAPQRQLRQRAA